MKILFIYPAMGVKEDYSVQNKKNTTKTRAIEPLTIATLSGLTPKEWDRSFFDDRIENIDYDHECDLVAITSETFTAKRAYEIAEGFRKKGKTIIMGGFHPSLCPEEAAQYADAIVIGEAEEIWAKVLLDFKKNKLEKFYNTERRSDLVGIRPDRSIFKDKKYFALSLVETGRGCKFDCEFCAVSLFFKKKFIRRPIDEIIDELKELKNKTIMFVDDNICADIQTAKKLFKALIPLKIKWVSQASINIVKDEELLDLMKQSGCLGLLIGFETIHKENLKTIGKYHNLDVDYNVAIKKLYKRKIKIYASFLMGYDQDNEQTIKDTLKFVIKNKFFIASFYQLTPFPGTRLYKRLIAEKRLLNEKWWLGGKNYLYGKVVYKPRLISAEKLSEACYEARKKFFSFNSIIIRARYNCDSPFSAFLYFATNFLTKKEVKERQWRKLGRKEFHG
ncbi:B12-binding domain-containing radical SAM protein [Candidatus Parcubacteria bacterium]|nr:B12-binding domain-containing radical SAM protein [Candidatus Parcubacteria bacterium]